jgi:hypothetical protein
VLWWFALIAIGNLVCAWWFVGFFTSLRIAPLGRAGSAVPGLTAYLALPPGWVVTREDDAFWVNAPGEEESRLDPPPPPLAGSEEA